MSEQCQSVVCQFSVWPIADLCGGELEFIYFVFLCITMEQGSCQHELAGILVLSGLQLGCWVFPSFKRISLPTLNL